MATSIQRTTTTEQTGSLFGASKNLPEDQLLTDLFTAYYCARKNKRNTKSQVRFERNLSDNLIGLYHEICERRYKVGRSMCFIINDPVKREVFAAAFRDRIVHHLLYNWLMPVFDRTFIYDSYSCRVGKGTLFGVERLEHHIRSCSDNFKKPCYVLKMDIEGYFMSIDRRRLFDIIISHLIKMRQKGLVRFDFELALYLLELVIFNEPTKGCYRKGKVSDWCDLPASKSLFYARSGCGLPIGNLTSQLFSNIYLSYLDDYIKRELRCRHYGRYVDDFYIVGLSKHEMMQLVPKIKAFLETKLELKLHPRKIRIIPVGQGVPFLGVVIKPYQRYMTHRSLSGAYRKLEEVWVHEPDPYKVQSVCNSYKGYSKHFSRKIQFR